MSAMQAVAKWARRVRHAGNLGAHTTLSGDQCPPKSSRERFENRLSKNCPDHGTFYSKEILYRRKLDILVRELGVEERNDHVP
jgi:hypothetical protein